MGREGGEVTGGFFYVGIDPGKKGGIAMVSKEGALVALERMPTEKALADYFRDIATLADNNRVVVVLEKSQSMPKQGVKSTFNYGMGYGMLKMGVLMAQAVLIEVRPFEWKKVMLQGVADKKDKGSSILRAEQLYPTANLVPGQCKKPHDGIAEALLLAEYGRRYNL